MAKSSQILPQETDTLFSIYTTTNLKSGQTASCPPNPRPWEMILRWTQVAEASETLLGLEETYCEREALSPRTARHQM